MKRTLRSDLARWTNPKEKIAETSTVLPAILFQISTTVSGKDRGYSGQRQTIYGRPPIHTNNKAHVATR